MRLLRPDEAHLFAESDLRTVGQKEQGAIAGPSHISTGDTAAGRESVELPMHVPVERAVAVGEDVDVNAANIALSCRLTERYPIGLDHIRRPFILRRRDLRVNVVDCDDIEVGLVSGVGEEHAKNGAVCQWRGIPVARMFKQDPSDATA